MEGLLELCSLHFWSFAGAKVVYTYDTFWELSEITWASRWDAYLRMPGGRVHWFSILNSLMVVLVMSSIVAMIMLRTIRRDLARYEGLLGDTGSPYALEPFKTHVCHDHDSHCNQI